MHCGTLKRSQLRTALRSKNGRNILGAYTMSQLVIPCGFELVAFTWDRMPKIYIRVTRNV